MEAGALARLDFTVDEYKLRGFIADTATRASKAS
jgi:hypothetical protein